MKGTKIRITNQESGLSEIYTIDRSEYSGSRGQEYFLVNSRGQVARTCKAFPLDTVMHSNGERLEFISDSDPVG